MRNQLTLLLVLLFSAIGFAQKGTVTGTLTDKDLNNEPLPFANVIVKGTTNGTTTDNDGKYTLMLEPGTYVIEFSFLGYETLTENVTVVAGQTVTVDKVLGAGSYTLQDVKVQSQVNREKESALLLEQQKSVTITQQIGAQELTRKGVSDAAAAVTKVTGISRQDGASGIYVRGLGDRYNSTTLNGLPLPSNEPTNKNVSLDLFSTDVIQSVGVSKTWYTDLYGDVGGANIDIVSKEHSGKTKLNIEVGSGINSYAFDSNNFKVADGIQKSGFFDVKKPNDLTTYQFENKWTPGRDSNPVDMNLGISGGTSFKVGEEGKLNVFGTASFENGYNLKKGSQLNIGNTNDNIIENFFDVNKYEYSTKTTGMANLAYRINKDHKIKFNTVFINASRSSVNEYDFTNENGSPSFTRQTINEQNKLFVNQLLGENKLSDRLDLDWGASFGKITSEMPDRSTIVLVEGANGFIFNTNTQSTNNRYFQKLDETEISGKAVAAYKLFKKADSDEYKGKLTFGYNGRFKKRDFEATQYNFRINGSVPVTEDTVDSFLNATNQSQSNNEQNTFRILTGRNAGSLVPFTYNPEVNIHTGLVNFEHSPSDKFTYSIGVRAEKVLQEMEWDTNIALPNVNFDDAKIDELYILPVATVKYAVNDKSNLRAVASKTYTLPQFVEKAPFRFEVVGESTVGNAFLKPSDNYNLDLKWEMFPEKDELISLTGFGKYIIDPISKARLNSALNDNTFVNAGDNAFVVGAEFEIRKNVWQVEEIQSLSVGFNATYMYSEQKLNSEKVAAETNNTISVSFNGDKDGLQGASPLLLNADVSYRFEKGDFRPTLTLVGNYFHDRIYSLGNIQSGGNVMEKGIPTLNFISSYEIGDHWNISLNLKNILNAKIERYQENAQGDFTTYSYKTGSDFSLGIKYSIF
ncbi:MAG: TonB-dependent receptor [Flavobacterium sp.]|uniref:TonB-dependent receptor domain-containing protein n=1 Tax=Flavobacterium sp. TaxID=239 RepID=UPI00121B971C|nr:TonB-dependent receptor [Flavobacterium sp.]RZJ68609.1 MAG: TonB-dependent receptor [Flavobacterium sp.]